MKNENEFAEVIDSIDNLLCALDIPMDAEFHVNQMKHELKQVSYKLKNIYHDEVGENPWD